MSNRDDGEVQEEPSRAAGPAGSWNSLAVVMGLMFIALVLFGTWEKPASGVEAEALASSRTVIRWHQTPIFSLAWSPDNRRLAASCFGPAVRVWDRGTGIVSTHEGGTEQPRFAVGWSEDGRKLMVSGLDLPIESWDLFDPKASEESIVSRPMDPSASTEALIKTTGARPIRLWGPSDKRFGLASKEIPTANSIAFSGDGRYFATGGVEGRLELRDPLSGRLVRTIEVEPRGITAVSFSPDGSKVATSGPGSVRIFAVDSGREVTRLGNEEGGSATLGFSPDGSKLAVATWDGSIQIWDLATGDKGLRLRGHHGQILAMAWSPDGKNLASGGYDSTVRVWDLAQNDPRSPLD